MSDEAPADPPPSSSAQSDEEPTSSNQQKEDANGRFECNICLDTAKDAVISMCGHLFCWPCLHQWLETRPHRQLCPVCKSAISRDKVIPLYGRSGDQTDPREKQQQVPPRPAGQRHEAPNHGGFPGLWGGDNGGGIHFSFGIGAFPFTLLASSFNFGDPRPAAPASGSRQHEEEQRISSLFIWIAVVFFIWLLLA